VTNAPGLKLSAHDASGRTRPDTPCGTCFWVLPPDAL